jgi:predicted membrane protein (TIGR00267 family)
MEKRLRDYLKILIEHEIVRRYVLINSFDGALTILGIVLAELFSGIMDPKLIILPSVGAAVAMSVSGIWGAYSAERAEIRKSIRTLEAHMMHDLSNTTFKRKREKMAWIIGIVDGLSPLLVSLVIITPFFLSALGMLAIMSAYYASLTLVAVMIFLLGALAGKIARDSMLKQGIIMLLAGAVIGAVFMVLVWTGVLK